MGVAVGRVLIGVALGLVIVVLCDRYDAWRSHRKAR